MENIEDNRRDWRELLFRSPGLGDYVSGAILFEETLYQKAADGTPFIEVLKEAGVVPGIKVDSGLKPLIGGIEGETWCSGLDDSMTNVLLTMHKEPVLPSGERLFVLMLRRAARQIMP
jgi:fructose-bisphosphate aldolase class I